MKNGARQGTWSGLRRLTAAAMARDLCAFVIPGPDIARAHGLDIEAAGLRTVASPRHASVLLVVGNISAELRDAASVVYAQMVRPRALFFLGAQDLSPLPAADVTTGLSQPDLIEGVRQLRDIFTSKAFLPEVEDFDAPMLGIRIEYVCPMHPEVVQDEPGNCPKCGMDLVPREAQAGAAHEQETHQETGPKSVMPAASNHAHSCCHEQEHKADDANGEYTCPMHPEVVQDGPGSCPKCGMHLVPKDGQEKSGEAHSCCKKKEEETSTEYTCPMHPEIVQNEPGSCPKCGMHLVPKPKDDTSKAKHEHHHMSHDHHKTDETKGEYTCPMHPEVVQDGPGSCPKCGMHLVPLSEGKSEKKHCCCQSKEDKEEHGHDHHMSHGDKVDDAEAEYTCPMHPEVVQKGPGSCPKCGMFLVPKEDTAEAKHEHHHMSHDHKVDDAEAEYTCPMHPEVVQKGPGSCPKCGMFLVPKDDSSEAKHEHHHMSHGDKADEAGAEYTCPMHPEVVQKGPGSCPKCGMFLVPKDDKSEAKHEHHHMSHGHKADDAKAEYTCPMHPEVVQDGPGSCPKCGMFLVPKDDTAKDDHSGHTSMDHGAMGHDDAGFMSMIDVTKDLPRSGDDLQMEWIEAPFGPFFPGLASGLSLTLTLDGDTVAGSDAHSMTGKMALLAHSPTKSEKFVEHLSSLEPLAPIAYRLLACRALENAGKVKVPADTARSRVGALERERIASHLSWLALFGEQTGFNWLMRRAATLQLNVQNASLQELLALKPALVGLIKRLNRTPLLKARTLGIGYLEPDSALRGPVARAAGISDDARSSDNSWTALGFTASSRTQSDAFARLHVRLDEITQSLALIEVAGAIAIPELIDGGDITATGEASVETARGLARLTLTLKAGNVVAAELETPSTNHLGLIEGLSDQQELGDALVAIGSLDLSPWEMQP